MSDDFVAGFVILSCAVALGIGAAYVSWVALDRPALFCPALTKENYVDIRLNGNCLLMIRKVH